jgi:hypothetical protein
MSETISFDLEGIFKCCVCEFDEWGFAKQFKRAPKPYDYYQKYPPIGRGRKLFFVSTNPRRSETNAQILDWAMESLDNFQELSRNRYNCAFYTDTEAFYKIHHRICEAIFPGRRLEDVAIVHELYLCATPKEHGLAWRSPCAKRFMCRHLNDACPRLVVAFGERAAKFLGCESRGDSVLSLENGTKVRVISLPHPNFRSKSNSWRWTKERRARASQWISRCYKIGISDPLPPRDFDEAQRQRDPRRRNEKWRRVDAHDLRIVTLTGNTLGTDAATTAAAFQIISASLAKRPEMTVGELLAENRELSRAYVQYLAARTSKWSSVIALDGMTGAQAPERS